MKAVKMGRSEFSSPLTHLILDLVADAMKGVMSVHAKLIHHGEFTR